MIHKRAITIGGVVLVVVGIVLVFMLRSAPDSAPADTDTTQPTTDTTATDTVEVESVNLFPDDNDRDGISNEEEQELGLDPTSDDTDLDGLADSFEINVSKTDPLNPDTDGDGIPDGREYLVFETDPNNVDSDGDGFDDATEIDNGYDPNGPGSL